MPRSLCQMGKQSRLPIVAIGAQVKVRLARSGYIVDAVNNGGGQLVCFRDQRIHLTASQNAVENVPILVDGELGQNIRPSDVIGIAYGCQEPVQFTDNRVGSLRPARRDDVSQFGDVPGDGTVQVDRRDPGTEGVFRRLPDALSA